MAENIGLEGRIMALDARINGHETLCTERWSEAKKAWEDTRADVKMLVELQSQAKGAMNAAKAVYFVIGAVGAAGVWAAKSLMLIR